MRKLIACLTLLSSLLVSCGNNSRPSLLVPSGAPLISVAGILDDINYTVTVGPDLLPVAFSKGEHDFIIAPITVGAKLYNLDKSTYQLAAMIGWGNLHILSRTKINDIAELEGENVLAFAEHATPGIMLRLATIGMNVDITYFKAVSDVGAPFLTKQYNYVLLSEPVLSKIISSSSEELYTYSLQNVTSLPSIAQFGLFVAPNVASFKVETFLDKLEDNIDDLNNDPSVYASNIIDKDEQFKELGLEVLTSSIPNLDFDYMSAIDAKVDVDDFLAFLVETDINIIGANNVDESFYAAY